MEKKLQGIALILFGILLVLAAMLGSWIPVIGVNHTDVGVWVGVSCGIAGLVFVFKKEP